MKRIFSVIAFFLFVFTGSAFADPIHLGANGRVGIGISNPSELLTVYGTSNSRILVSSPSGSAPEFNLTRGSKTWNLWMTSENDFHFFQDGFKVVFTDDGTVGPLPACPQCTEDSVILTNETFPDGTVCECTAATSITIGNGTTVKNGGFR